jgi:hypothetical protein
MKLNWEVLYYLLGLCWRTSTEFNRVKQVDLPIRRDGVLLICRPTVTQHLASTRWAASVLKLKQNRLVLFQR